MTKQWVTTNVGLELLDMPGVLWPKYFQTREKFLEGRKSQVLLLKEYTSQSLHCQQAIIHGPSSQMIRWYHQQQLGQNSETVLFIDFISQLTRLCWEVKMHCNLYH